MGDCPGNITKGHPRGTKDLHGTQGHLGGVPLGVCPWETPGWYQKAKPELQATKSEMSLKHNSSMCVATGILHNQGYPPVHAWLREPPAGTKSSSDNSATEAIRDMATHRRACRNVPVPGATCGPGGAVRGRLCYQCLIRLWQAKRGVHTFGKIACYQNQGFLRGWASVCGGKAGVA